MLRTSNTGELAWAMSYDCLAERPRFDRRLEKNWPFLILPVMHSRVSVDGRVRVYAIVSGVSEASGVCVLFGPDSVEGQRYG